MTMALRRILDYPDPRLKTIAPPVDNIQLPAIQQVIDDMLETLIATPHCGGLAATQLDIKDPKRIFVFFDSNKQSTQPQCIVNPEVVATYGEVIEPEGCMSVYCQYISATIKRPQCTEVVGLDRYGNTITLKREQYLAKLFIHEIDHLNGILCIDHLTSLKRKIVDKKIAKLRRWQKRKQATVSG